MSGVLSACERGAINHEMEDESVELTVGTIVLATGFQDFDPSAGARARVWASWTNVITAMEFERLINSGGPDDRQGAAQERAAAQARWRSFTALAAGTPGTTNTVREPAACTR